MRFRNACLALKRTGTEQGHEAWCHERAYPECYDEVKTAYLGPLFQPMADALRADAYDGVISFETVYHPDNGNFEDGFRASIGLFKRLFG